MGELYKLDFPNGKSYIGITKKTAAKRFKGHSQAARLGCRSPLYNAWRKHGEPTLMILAVLEDDDLHAAEIRAIKAFGTLLPGGYNATRGGDLNPMELEENRMKVSASKKGENNPMKNEEFKTIRDKKRNEWLKTAEAKQKMSDATKNAIKSNPGLIEINRKRQKEVWSRPGYKEKMSAKAKEAWTRRKANGECVFISEEERKARSERAKRQWANGNIGNKQKQGAANV